MTEAWLLSLLVFLPAMGAIVVAFFAISHGLTSVLPRALLNSSVGYLPALAALLAAGEAARRGQVGGCAWQFASAATGGRLLCNTKTPFLAPWMG
jgi:hypothetical protein